MTTVNQDPSWKASASMRTVRQFALGALLLSTSAFLSACGGCGPDEPAEDKCETMTCERGQCEPTTGMCVNNANCDGDDELCLEGYSCQGDGTCQADVACAADGTCVRGDCVAGACVSPETCAADMQCVEGSICEGGTCTKDLCADKTCDRGVCARTTGECVNATTCTESQEATQCVDGFKCNSQQCVDEATFCERLACTRGVCSFDTKGCVDAADCGGEDASCLAGNFCNDANTCMANVCLPEGSKCMGGGECVEASGECINPASCEKRADCLPMNLCVSGACIAEADACGTEGCPGNQTCFYNEPDLEAVCQENTLGCTNALDCTDNRICDAGSCGPGLPCADDEFEPNDAADEATSYADAKVVGAVRASVCSGDTDLYTFDATEAPVQGVLLVSLDYAASDVGLGSLKVELLSPTGMVLEQADADANGKVRLSRNIGVTRGVYSIRVSDGGNVLSSGVFYSLSVNVVERTTITACESAPSLDIDTEEMSTTISGASTALRSSCADTTGVAAEDIYQIEVTERSYVTVSAISAATADVSVSLRAECLSNDSEIPGACADRGELGSTETINALLDPGTYFIVVQGDDVIKGGSYTLSWSREEVICTSADDSCTDSDTARVCAPNGSSFETDECGARGCNMGSGRCNRPPGDRCDITSTTVTKAMSPFVSAPIIWSDLQSDYDPGAMGCVAASADDTVATDGADISLRIEVPANHGLSANLVPAMGSTQDVSLYLVSDCLLLDQCEVGVNAAAEGGVETLLWFNDTSLTKTMFLVADSKGAASMTTASLQIEINEVICAQGDTICTTIPATGAVSSGSCNILGTAYDITEECFFGCDMATGLCNPPSNDVCDMPLPITSGVVISGRIDDYANNHNINSAGSECRSILTSGGDAVYSFDAVAGDIVSARLAATFDSVLWANSGCNTAIMPADLTGCIQSDDVVLTGGGGEELDFVIPTDGTYFITVAAWSASGSGTFDLTVDVLSPNCTPGQPVQCDAAGTSIEYCDSRGVLTPYPCGGAGTCSGGACDMPSGDVCLDALVLGRGVTTTTGMIDSFTPRHSVGPACSPRPSTNGKDVTYAVDLLAGDVMEASLTGSFDTVLWVSGGCDGNDNLPTCIGADDGFGRTERVDFVAPTDGTYYISVAAWSAATSTGSYTLTVDVQSPNCTPGQPIQCNAMGTELEYCDSRGVLRNYTCGGVGTCSNGLCDEPYGNTCADAVPLVSGVMVSDEISTYANTHSIGTGCTSSSTSGGDVTYRIEALAGDVIDATLTSPFSAALWISSGCDITKDAIPGCLQSVTSGTPRRASIVAPSDGTYYITVASTSSTGAGIYNLTVDVQSPNCTPGQPIQCDTAGTGLEYCDGRGLLQTYACSGASGTCTAGKCDMPTGDICVDAIPVTKGPMVSIMGSIDSFTPRHSVGPACSPRPSTNGKDVTYAVDLLAGDVMEASLTGSFDTVLWVSGGCDGNDNLPTCIGADDGISRTERVDFVAPTDGTYYISVAAWSAATSTGSYTLTVDVQSPNCTPGQPTQCDTAGTGLEYCDERGFLQTYACSGAPGICSGGACGMPTGRVCPDSVSLNPSGEVMGTQSGSFDIAQGSASFEMPSGVTGECDVTSASDGTDTFYSVSLAAGDLLELDLQTTNSSAHVYVLQDCTMISTCLQNLTPTGAGRFFFTAPANGIYSVVVDTSSETNTAPFTLSWRVLSNTVCQPDSVYCADPMTVARCDAQGASIEYSYACATSCTNGGCQQTVANIDVCAATTGAIAGSSIVNIPWGTPLTNNVNLTSPNCTGTETDGPDAFFSVDVAAGDVLEATVLNRGTTGTPLLYVVDDCASAASTNTCLAGASGVNAQVYWLNDTGALATVKVAVDNSATSPTGTAQVEIRTLPSECIPGPNANICENQGGPNEVLRYCRGTGLFFDYECDGLCGGTTAGQCDNPTGDVCIDAIPLTSSGSISGMIDGATPQHNVGIACTSRPSTSGGDVTYSLDLVAGDSVTATLSGSFDTVLWASGGCDGNEMLPLCLEAEDNVGTPETISFVAATDGTYYISVAAWSASSTTGTYTLDLVIQ